MSMSGFSGANGTATRRCSQSIVTFSYPKIFGSCAGGCTLLRAGRVGRLVE
jgi:hypothetical protein